MRLVLLVVMLLLGQPASACPPPRELTPAETVRLRAEVIEALKRAEDLDHADPPEGPAVALAGSLALLTVLLLRRANRFQSLA